MDQVNAAALTEFELITGRRVMQQTWKLYLDGFPEDGRAILLPYPPLQSVSSVEYVDASGDTQTWSSSAYIVDAAAEPGRIRLAYNESYPVTRRQPRAVTITFVCGYTASHPDLPGVKQVLLISAADFFEHRESWVAGMSVAEVPGRRSRMYWPYRVLGADS